MDMIGVLNNDQVTDSTSKDGHPWFDKLTMSGFIGFLYRTEVELPVIT